MMRIKIIVGLTLIAGGVFAQGVPESLKKQDDPIEESVSKETKPDIPDETEIIENKPVREDPVEDEQEKEPVESKKSAIESPEMENFGRRLDFFFSFQQNLKDNGVKTCLSPLTEMMRSFFDSPDIKDVEVKNSLIRSAKSEPIVMIDYDLFMQRDVEYASRNTSLQATPFPEHNTCFINQIEDVVIENVETCQGIDVADGIDWESSFENQFGGIKNFHRVNNRLLTFNDLEGGGCHIRTMVYRQFVDN